MCGKAYVTRMHHHKGHSTQLHPTPPTPCRLFGNTYPDAPAAPRLTLEKVLKREFCLKMPITRFQQRNGLVDGAYKAPLKMGGEFQGVWQHTHRKNYMQLHMYTILIYKTYIKV